MIHFIYFILGFITLPLMAIIPIFIDNLLEKIDDKKVKKEEAKYFENDKQKEFIVNTVNKYMTKYREDCIKSELCDVEILDTYFFDKYGIIKFNLVVGIGVGNIIGIGVGERKHEMKVGFNYDNLLELSNALNIEDTRKILINLYNKEKKETETNLDYLNEVIEKLNNN